MTVIFCTVHFSEGGVRTPSSETTKLEAASSSLKSKIWKEQNVIIGCRGPQITQDRRKSTHTSHNGVNNYYRTYNPNFPPLELWIIVIIQTKSLFFFISSSLPIRHTWWFLSLLVVTDTQVYDTELPTYVFELINALLCISWRYILDQIYIYSWNMETVLKYVDLQRYKPNNFFEIFVRNTNK